MAAHRAFVWPLKVLMHSPVCAQNLRYRKSLTHHDATWLSTVCRLKLCGVVGARVGCTAPINPATTRPCGHSSAKQQLRSAILRGSQDPCTVLRHRCAAEHIGMPHLPMPKQLAVLCFSLMVQDGCKYFARDMEEMTRTYKNICRICCTHCDTPPTSQNATLTSERSCGGYSARSTLHWPSA